MMTEDELLFCIECIRSAYPGVLTDSPDKVQKLIEDIFDKKVDMNMITELYDNRLIEEDEAAFIYKDFF
jgi:hypothetical protein